MGSSVQKTKGLLTPICQAYKNQLCAVVPATQALTYKTITPTVDTNVVATYATVPVAVSSSKPSLETTAS